MPDVAVVIEEKPSSTSTLSFLTDNAIAATISDTYSGLSARRKLLGLENPGTVDNIAREVQKDVLLSNFMFSGLRCDFQKVFSINPLFRLQHGFAMGSQALPPWQLMALYGNSDVRVAQLPRAPRLVRRYPLTQVDFHASCLLERPIPHRVWKPAMVPSLRYQDPNLHRSSTGPSNGTD